MKKKILSWLLALSVVSGLLTMPAFAADDDSIVRLLDEDQGTIDPYAGDLMNATFTLPETAIESSLNATIVNNVAAIPMDIKDLYLSPYGECDVEGGCPYRVSWDGTDEDGDIVLEGTYELRISAQVVHDTDEDIAYITVVHTENLVRDIEIDKDPVDFEADEILTIIYESVYGDTGDYFELLILDENDETVKTFATSTKVGENGEAWIWQILWDGKDDLLNLVEEIGRAHV